MRLIALHIFKWRQNDAGEGESTLLANEMDLSMLYFFQRGMAKEHVNFNARLISSRTPTNNKQAIVLEEGIGVCYCWTAGDGLSATAVCDKEYPERAAFILLNKIMMEFRETFGDNQLVDTSRKDLNLKWPQLEVYLKDCQNPVNADKLLQVEKEL